MRFAFHYIIWHYSSAIRDLIGIVINFIWFFFNFFSIETLLKTLFLPFGRLGEKYKKGVNVGAWAETFIVNALMRIVGFLLRICLIFIGLVLILLTIIIGITLLLAWLFAPFLLVFLVSFGFKLLSIG